MADHGLVFVREEWGGEQVRIPLDDLRRLFGYVEEPAVADRLGTVIRRADEARTWRFVDVGEEETRAALARMDAAEGLTPALEEARRLVAAAS